MNVVVDGLMTNYQKIGSGKKTIVFLHGWGDSAKTFSALASLLRDYSLLMLDLPGFGGTQLPPTAWDTNDFANFINHWLKKIDAGPIYAIVGHSFGGAMAVSGLASGTIKASKLVLLASAGIRGKKSFRNLSLKVMAKIIRLLLFFLPKHYREKLRVKVYRLLGSDLVLLAHMEPTFRRIIDDDVKESAAKLKLPTLLIYGSKDNQTPVSDGRILNGKIVGSKLEVIDGAGHFLHQERPEQVAEMVKDFVGVTR